jgi:hypothetical protein
MPRHAVFTSALLATVLVACGGSPATPSSQAVVTFTVANESFRVLLTSADQIAAARAAQAGGQTRIPNGKILAGAQVNTGWSWHLEDIEFADLTTEVCDGRPSDVEREGTRYGGGRYCPWGARVTAIEMR